MTSFKSDFSLFPIKKLGRSGWEYRVATWPKEIDPVIHKLFDGEIDGPVNYIRKKNYDGKIQNCRVLKRDDYDYVMEPGDGYDFIVRKDSDNNKEDVDNDSIPHDMLCLICMDNKKTHVIVPCFHVVSCASCAPLLFANKKECPLCKNKYTEPLKKLYF